MIKFEMDTAELHPSTTAWRRFWLSHVMTEKGKPLAARACLRMGRTRKDLTWRLNELRRLASDARRPRGFDIDAT